MTKPRGRTIQSSILLDEFRAKELNRRNFIKRVAAASAGGAVLGGLPGCVPARSDDDDLLTGFGNWFFTRTVNVLFGAKYTDVMVLFRAYRKSLIAELGLDRDDAFAGVERLWRTGPPGSLHWDPLLAVRARIAGCRVAEIPASEPARIGGNRKLRVFSWGGAVYLQFILEFLRPYRSRRPTRD